MRLIRSAVSVKLALATVAVSCMALMLDGGAATAATSTKADAPSASAALLQKTGLRDAPAAQSGPKPTIFVTRSNKVARNSNGVADGPLTVMIVNLTQTTFQKVNMANSRHSVPGFQFQEKGPLAPFTVIQFDIANCTDVKQYAFHIILNNQIVGRSGDITPDATDGDLCSDVWDLG